MKRIPELDGMRGLAVFAVLFSHSKFRWGAGGAYGVDLFFVLSGYLITSILTQEYQTVGKIDLKRFYIRRALRLFPALFCVVAACCVTESLLGAYDDGPGIWTRSLWTLTYISNWVWAFSGNMLLGPLTATWSLAVEEQFYLLWPITLIVLFRCKIQRRSIAFLCLIAALASACLHLWLMNGGASWERTYAGADTRGGVILLGCALALLQPDIERVFPKIPSWAGPLIGATSLGFLFFMFSTGLYGSLELAGFYRLVVGIAALALIAAALYGVNTVSQRLLRFAPLVWVGQISYGIYLWHSSANSYLARYAPASPIWIRIAVGLLLATASYYLLERRFLRLKESYAPSADPRPEVEINGAAQKRPFPVSL
jgi:peptidoglycan/LPS O-acetylase OafA/YrhL